MAFLKFFAIIAGDIDIGRIVARGVGPAIVFAFYIDERDLVVLDGLSEAELEGEGLTVDLDHFFGGGFGEEA